MNQYFHGFDISHHKPLCGSRFKVMPPRKRKLQQTVENVSVKDKKKMKKRDHVTTTSTESTAETTYQAKKSNADTATLTMGHSEPPALQSLSYESGQRPVTLPLSSGLQSTISSVTLNGECDHDPLPICTFNDLDIFISEASRQKIWNSEYIDLAHLLRQNYCPNTESMGTLTLVDNNLSVKTGSPKFRVPINSIELWTDAFINFTMVFGIRHKEKTTELLKYMTIIRGAAANNPIQKWATYDTQFRLRMAKDPNRSWANIDGHLWLSCGLSGDLSATVVSTAPCYEYNFKGFCGRMNCGYSHTCIKCKVEHPASTCNLFNETKFQSGLRNKTPDFSGSRSYAQQNFRFAAPVAPPVQHSFQRYSRQPYQFQPRQQPGRQFRPGRFRFQQRYMGPRGNAN